ncbi:hypothetical protein LJB81_02550 [Desulfovibrio sp. OttesenSCG-928-M14]|nr:hypothetical protein [Desulfovibrio sp. OttesenSCG-928-M14]
MSTKPSIEAQIQAIHDKIQALEVKKQALQKKRDTRRTRRLILLGTIMEKVLPLEIENIPDLINIAQKLYEKRPSDLAVLLEYFQSVTAAEQCGPDKSQPPGPSNPSPDTTVSLEAAQNFQPDSHNDNLIGRQTRPGTG